MEDQFSRLYAGPLSASAQRIVAALRAEYANRLDRSHTCESDSKPHALIYTQQEFELVSEE